jgi:hypothetical protein
LKKEYAMKKSSLVKVTGNIFGTVLQYNLIITGIVIGGIAVLAGKKSTGKAIQKTGIKLGSLAGKTVRTSGRLAGILMEAASNEGVQLSKSMGNRVIQSRVRIYGDASQFFDKDKMVEAEGRGEELIINNYGEAAMRKEEA